MKFCSSCGASLADSAVSFCSECGSPVKASASHAKEQKDATTKPTEDQTKKANEKQPRPVKKKRKRKGWFVRKKKSHTKEGITPKSVPVPNESQKKASTEVAADVEIDPQDIGYDGYYNDIPPLDNGAQMEKMDPDMLKKVILITGGTVLIVVIAIIALYLM